MATGVRFFNNTIIDADFLCNYMVNCQRGITIEQCDISNQGSYNLPIDDQWVYSGNFSQEADIRGFNAPINKIWFVRNFTYPFGPDKVNYIKPINTVVPSLGNTNASFNCTNPCGTIFTCKQKKLASIAKNQSPYNTLAPSEQYLAKKSTFNALLNEPALLQQGTPEDSVLQSFKDSIMQTDLGKLTLVEEFIGNGNIVQAKQINDSIVPANFMEMNQKLVNDVYLRTWALGGMEIDSVDKSKLETIAFQNPIDGGIAVYSARVILGLIQDDFSPVSTARMANSELKRKEILGVENNFITKLYPNPNDGNMQIDYNLENGQNGVLIISDIIGQRIKWFSFQNDRNYLKISDASLKNGVYFYEIWVDEELILSDKIIIIK